MTLQRDIGLHGFVSEEHVIMQLYTILRITLIVIVSYRFDSLYIFTIEKG